MDYSFAPTGGWVWVTLVAVVLLVLLVLGPARSRTTPPRRRALVLLRLGVILLVVLLMLRPGVVRTTSETQAATLVVLLDRSRSMQVADDGSQMRWDRLKETLVEAVPVLAELAETLEVQVYTFDTETHPLPLVDGQLADLGPQPVGDQTAIGAVITQVLREQAGKRLVGIVLLTDGNQKALAPYDREPTLAVRRINDFPLHTVVYGRPEGGQMRDVSLESLLVNRTVHVKNLLAVEGQALINGYLNQDVRVELEFETPEGKMEVVETADVKATRNGELVPIQLQYAPPTPGTYKLTLRLVKQQGELVVTNNERSTFVTVLEGGLNVLYLEGQPPRLERKFILKSLRSSPDVEVVYARLDAKSPDAAPEDPPPRTAETAQILEEALQPGKFDVYVLDNLDVTAFEPAELQALREIISRRAGLIMIGGPFSFGPGGYAQSPLEEVLPVRMNRLERQNQDAPIRPDVHLAAPLKMRPSPLAAGSYVIRLSGVQDNAEVWASLPPLDGANRLVAAAPVLLESDSGEPLLVAGTYGEGRVLAFAGDSTWRWWLQGHRDLHKRFWRQVVLWLAFMDDVNEGSVWVDVDERRVRLGGRVTITAGARSPQGDPLPEAQYDAAVVRPDGTRSPLRLNRLGDEMTATFADTQAPGDYRVAVTASDGGTEIGTASARFLVYQQDLELERPVADLTAMQQLSAMTPGGQSITPEQLPRLLEELKKVPDRLTIVRLDKLTLWDAWLGWLPPVSLLCLLLVAFLCLEWFLRKKWGLV